MAKYELSGLVKPEVSDAGLDKAARRMERTLGEAAKLTPDLDLGRAEEQLGRLTSPLGGPPSIPDSAPGSGGDSVQVRQLEELQSINRTLRQGAVDDAEMPGQAAGTAAGTAIGMSALAGVGGLAAAGGNQLLTNKLKGLLKQRRPGAARFLRQSAEYRTTSIADVGASNFANIGTVMGQSLGREAGEWLMRSYDWPELPDLSGQQWPKLPSLSGNARWPTLPDLSNQTQWPGLPELSQQVEWPEFKEPEWVRELLKALRSAGLLGGKSGQQEPVRRGSRVDRGPGRDFRGDTPGPDVKLGPVTFEIPPQYDDEKRRIQSEVEKALRKHFGTDTPLNP